ncbi:MAG: helix-turn-helix transcriptional regulator [Halothiobacillus sp.]|jgi:DNA-binding XRE family transcriptional regulator|nr:helix-turn-helix transcriptional regulator [Halothiobacillus sp.]
MGRRKFGECVYESKRTLVMMGHAIAVMRKTRKWTKAELADRVGITTETLTRVEKGDDDVSVGITFDCAVIVGIDLFGDKKLMNRADLCYRVILDLMPKRIVSVPASEFDDGF